MTIAQIKKANKRAGWHWFDEKTMAFFQSRIESKAKGNHFITSEKPPHGPRHYSIRRFNTENKQIKTAGDFGEFQTLREAKDQLKKILA